jgi:hypothetical protein
MDEGWHLLTRLLVAVTEETDSSELRLIGKPVEVTFTADPRNDARRLPTFRLRGER